MPTGSMEPTIHVGDRILVNKLAFDFKLPFTNINLFKMGEPSLGDVVVFLYPQDPSVVFVKRLLGRPGDHVLIERGMVWVNGQGVEVDSSLVEKLLSEQNDFQTMGQLGEHRFIENRIPSMLKHSKYERLEFVVPEDSYFVMGDNRDNSHDSRAWGFVPRENLKGRASHKLLNFRLSPLHLSLSSFGERLS